MDDRRGKLEAEPFDYRVTGDGKVLISWRGRAVVTLKGSRAQKFIAQVEGLDDDHAVQLVLARFTGNFKRGNERRTPERVEE